MDAPATVELDGQYRSLREGAGLLDRSQRGKLLVEGADAAEFLQGQLTNDVEALEPGEGCYAALLNRKGRMQADLRLLRLSPVELWVDTEPIAIDPLLRHLELYRVGREVSIRDVGPERAILSLIGPAAAELTGGAPLGEEHSHREIELGGSRCVAVTTSDGLDLICTASDSAAAHEALLTAGADEVSPEASEILRVEAGRPRFGAEMTTETIPEEAGINERAVSFTKGCYVGQETVARLHYKGKPNRRLRGVRLDAAARANEPIRLDEREIGRIGTAVLSPALGPIALAILRREAAPGDRVRVGDDNGGEVVELPFAAGGQASG
jgi:folate-binding protein YgfZ